MKLLEFESRKLLEAVGIPVPAGAVVTSSQEVRAAIEVVGRPVVIKAQIPIGGRMKAGGVIFADNVDDAVGKAAELLGKVLLKYPVDRLLIQKRVDVRREYYLAVTYDTVRKCTLVIASAEGGIEIEELASTKPSTVVKEHIPVSRTFSEYKGRELASMLGLRGKDLLRFADIAFRLYNLFTSYDATITEINPLVQTATGEFVAVDAHIDIDDDALYRHRDLSEKFGIEPRESYVRPPTTFEMQAVQVDKRDYRGVAGRVVEFEGNLGMLIGGGGASLTAFDAILGYGGRPANYCEIGGNPSVGKLCDLTKLILSKPGVEKIAVLMNVVNNTRVDLVARGVIKGVVASGKVPSEAIAVFRIPGAWEDEGFKILRKYNIEYYDRSVSIDEAARRAVEKMGDAYGDHS